MKKGIALAVLFLGLISVSCATGPTPEELEAQRKAQQEEEAKRKAEIKQQVLINLSIGNEHYKNREYRDAINSFLRIVRELDPTEKRAWRYLADSYYQLGKIDSAKAIYKEAISLFPDESTFHYGLGYMMELEKQDSLAVEHYRKAVTLDSTNYVAAEALGRTHLRAGAIDSVIYWYEKASHLDSTNLGLWKDLVKLYKSRARWEDAAQANKMVCRLEPDNIKNQLDLAQCQARAGNYDEAISKLEQMIAKTPEDPEVNHILGIAYMEKGDHSSALKYMNKAKKLNPDNPKIYCDIAMAYLKQKNYAKAEKFANTALSKKSGYGYAYIILGEVKEAKAREAAGPKGELTYDVKLIFEEAYNLYRKALSDPDWHEQAKLKIKYIKDYLPTEEEKRTYEFLKKGRMDTGE